MRFITINPIHNTHITHLISRNIIHLSQIRGDTSPLDGVPLVEDSLCTHSYVVHTFVCGAYTVNNATKGAPLRVSACMCMCMCVGVGVWVWVCV